MKKQLLAAGFIAMSLLALTAKDKDPVLMNVAGKDVHISEFEYLFHKNNTQQVKPQTIDEYVGMFVDYKLKVADAEAAGIDTTKAFIDEFTKFRNELSEPYMKDEAKLDSMVAETYKNMSEELYVSHIMVGVNYADRLDSLRNEILNGNITFEEAARQYSIDSPSAVKGGKMGYVIPGRYPWAFESAAFNTGLGQISPVVNSGFGQHLIRVDKRNPNPGEVNVEHIIRLTGNKTESEERQKQIIDSIYMIVKADPSKFEELAKQYSQDGASAKGGSLDWLSRGMTVTEFDSVAFALPKGAISEPFKSEFGWHIVKKVDMRGIGTLEENRDKIVEQINRSERVGYPEAVFLAKQRPKYNAAFFEESLEAVCELSKKHNSMIDSTFYEELKISEIPAYRIGKKICTIGNVMQSAPFIRVEGTKQIRDFVRGQVISKLNDEIRTLTRNDLMNENEDYRNLVKEYRDGILLFEISNQNVWNKASKDKDGLENFFNQNRDKYTWDAPKFKSYIVYANSDSVLNAAVDYAKTAPSDMEPSDFVKYMREKFGRNVKIERVIAAKGENAFVDYLEFGGPKPENKNKRWTSYQAVNGRLLTAPEDASDVRGAVVSDYQNYLEKEWLEKLHKKYKVKINKSILKKVK